MITSLTNEKIKEIVKLKELKSRKEKGLFIVEGPHLVSEAKELGLLVEAYSIDERYEGTLVSEAVMKKLCSTTSPVKQIGICKIVNNNKLSNRILILDEIKDPTNLGTLLRSAKSFGFDTVVASLNSVDFYNDKVIRGSQGAIFKLNLISADLNLFIPSVNKEYAVYGTNVRNGISIEDASFDEKVCLVLGNEAHGMSDEVSNLCHKNIYIKLDNMESLNVSVAGSILMYEINKKVINK